MIQGNEWSLEEFASFQYFDVTPPPLDDFDRLLNCEFLIWAKNVEVDLTINFNTILSSAVEVGEYHGLVPFSYIVSVLHILRSNPCVPPLLCSFYALHLSFISIFSSSINNSLLIVNDRKTQQWEMPFHEQYNDYFIQTVPLKWMSSVHHTVTSSYSALPFTLQNSVPCSLSLLKHEPTTVSVVKCIK